MTDLTDYLELVTSAHSDKPKYMAMLEAVIGPMADVLNVMQALPADFDLDQAGGAQLDIAGLWAGVGRRVMMPLDGVYFSLDEEGVGFNLGVWKEPFDPETRVISLDDETYRILIKAKIGANRWDGTIGQSREILDLVFSGNIHVFMQDNQNMTVTIGVAGERPSSLLLSLLAGEYIPIKPAGVKIDCYIVSSGN